MKTLKRPGRWVLGVADISIHLQSTQNILLWFPAAAPLEKERFGFPAFSGISRLTWLVALFGELSLVSATLEERKEEQYMKMTVSLETKNKW